MPAVASLAPKPSAAKVITSAPAAKPAVPKAAVSPVAAKISAPPLPAFARSALALPQSPARPNATSTLFPAPPAHHLPEWAVKPVAPLIAQPKQEISPTGRLLALPPLPGQSPLPAASPMPSVLMPARPGKPAPAVVAHQQQDVSPAGRLPLPGPSSLGQLVLPAASPAPSVSIPTRAAKSAPAVVAQQKQTISPGGQSLLPAVQQAIENSLGVSLDGVQIHADSHAHKAAESFSARAFTYGNHIFLGKDETVADLRLIAHEATHVVQQQGVPSIHRSAAGQTDTYEQEADRAASAVARGEKFTVNERVASPRVQRWGLSSALDKFADWANAIPGFRMFTIVLGMNPINMSAVDRNAANIMRAVVEFIPGGALITQALDKYGVFDKVGAWVEQQIRTLGLVGSSLKKAVDDFVNGLHWSDIVDLGGVWERAKRIFTEPIDRIKKFVAGLANDILKFIKDAVLMPLAKLAEGTRGWDLLIAVLGKNPITGEEVQQNADTLIGGFMKLAGEEEVWNNLKKANAVSRAWTWFQGALKGLLGFVKQIPDLFVQALKSLEIADIIVLPNAFLKVGKVFANFVVDFVKWAGDTVWTLLQIIFEVVAPAAMPYLKKVGAAFKSILKNPIGFVRNLVAAGKLGFVNFGSNFLTHLKAGLIEWLTGSLPGVYIPKAISLPEVGKFAMSVLGITWAQIRGKIVKALGPTGEKIMVALETTFDVVVALVTGGPAAAWELIKEKLTNLKEMVIDGITSFVVDTIVKKAVPKLIAMFIPGAGFVSAIVSIYDTIMVFVQKLAKIAAAVKAFVDSIVAIAAGQIEGAANKVESTLGGLLSLAISFLAGFLGLGNIASKVLAVIEKIRAAVDKALDTAIAWVVGKAKALFAKLFGKKEASGPEHDQKVQEGLAALDKEKEKYIVDGSIAFEDAQKAAMTVKAAHPVFQTLTVVDAGDDFDFDYVASPGKRYQGAHKQTGALKVATWKLKDEGKSEQLAAAQASGAAWEEAVMNSVIKEIFVAPGPGTTGRWEIVIKVPIEINVQGMKDYKNPSREDLARLKVQKGHIAGGRRGVPEVTMEVREPGGKGALAQVRAVEITLVDDFSKVKDKYAVHKVQQFDNFVEIVKAKYSTVPVYYFFICPRPPSAETKDYIVGTLQSKGVTNMKVVWTVLK